MNAEDLLKKIIAPSQGVSLVKLCSGGVLALIALAHGVCLTRSNDESCSYMHNLHVFNLTIMTSVACICVVVSLNCTVEV